MSDKENMFKRGWKATKGGVGKAAGWTADKTWRGGKKRKYATGAAGVAAVGVGGYYAHRKLRRSKMESGE